MITPDDIRQRATRWWTDQSFLRSHLTGDDYFAEPKSIGRIGLDDETKLATQFARIMAEQEALLRGSREQLGYGYTLHRPTKQKRMLGNVRLIQRITFDTPTDWLRFIGKTADFDRFVDLVGQTRRTVPELEPWLRRYPLRLLDNGDTWPDWLAVCRYFRDEYVPDRYYVRQLPIPVHTKFLETQQALLLSLLGTVRPGLLRLEQKNWDKRLGLLVPEPMIRIRALDDTLRLDGKHSDFGLPLSAFARYMQPADRVFICENLLSFLTFPPMHKSIAIWGSGFAVTLLGGTGWLGAKQLYYWGDIDVHGFQILSTIRGLYPEPGVESLLMDQVTFYKFHHNNRGGTFNELVLTNLNDDEEQLYNLLLKENWRIEQEKITEDWIISVLKDDKFSLPNS